MTKIYKKKNPLLFRRYTRLFGLLLCVFGLLMVGYFTFPLLSFQLYLSPAFASQKIAAPIPERTMLTQDSFKDLIQSTAETLAGVDYTDAKNWYPSIQQAHTDVAVSHYKLSVPKINDFDLDVSTVDTDLNHHLVQYGGTAVPPSKGTAVIFGHSTLPQLFKQGDYDTVFAYAHTLQVGDEIDIKVDNLNYTYRIYNITITSPLDTSFFAQNYDDNYLILVTCTPPGTTWRRLLIRAKIVKPGETQTINQ
ncbi:class C sortase [soil metagenome]